jgi:hypothetical protein
MARTHCSGKDGKEQGTYKFSKAGAFRVYSEQAKRWTLQGSNSTRGKDFSLFQNVQTDCVVHRYLDSIPGVKRLGCGIDHASPPVSRLKVSAAISPLSGGRVAV